MPLGDPPAPPAAAAGGRFEPAPREPDLRDALGLLWRRKWLILTTALAGTLATATTVVQLSPRYTAEAQMLIAPRAAKVVDIEDVLEALRPDRTTVQTEVEVLRSRALAEEVAGRLRLSEVPEFNRRLRPPSLRNPLDWLGRLLDPERDAAGEAGRSARDEDEAVDALLQAVTVNVVKLSRVVAVGATSEDPELAAAIANTLADAYLDAQVAEKDRATSRAASWLNERVAALREQVETSNRAVEDHRQRHGLAETSDTILVEQQISEVNTRLVAARARTAEADARLRQARELAATEDGIYGASDVLASRLIQDLRMQETRLMGEAAQMATEYGPRHPKMINAGAELSDIQATIAAEVERIVGGLENALEVAQTGERALRQSLGDLRAEAARLTAAQARLRVLEREAEANQTLFDVFLARWKETGQQEGRQSADGRIISRATVPTAPSWPNVPATVAIALVAFTLLGLALTYLAEQLLERGFRHPGQLEDALGVGALTSVPILSGSDESFEDHVLDKPSSALAESLRMLHTGLLLTDADETPCTSVLITSSVASEGKTFIALSLARLLASMGRKALLIDADLRHGQVERRLGLRASAGLAELLTGGAGLAEQFIARDERSGLDVLLAGRSTLPVANILQSRQMSRLLESLRTRYELIVIDSPPLLLVSDARTLARLADHTVFVVRYGDTPRKVAATGIKSLAEAEAHVTGAALSMVETRKGSGYYPYGYGYGYGPGAYGMNKKYASYYAER